MARLSSPCAIDKRVRRDRRSRQQCETDRSAIKSAEVPTAAQRQCQNACTEDEDTAPSAKTEMLADQQRRAERRHQRRRTAGYRIDLPQVAQPIGLCEAHVINEMQNERGDDEGPGRRQRQPHERQERQGDESAGRRDERHRHDRLKPHLEQRVPAGVKSGRGQHRREYVSVHWTFAAPILPTSHGMTTVVRQRAQPCFFT